MEKHTFGPEYGFATRAVHTGNDIDQDSGAIKRPVFCPAEQGRPCDFFQRHLYCCLPSAE